ncbi:hypothetical protein [Candidatus Deferrimicrobium sp.]|uniref:hypothetical protein n=1 Tax=Candidatus Deferrimicrobium sp. TaxID=3060586 RepID=UPI0027246A1F|nr:hypothetical protein [Candidatus Deferrimicrobium sp.]MDO8739731.1 hypothetical protein [Candidatus Deferrimicrobium sp.]
MRAAIVVTVLAALALAFVSVSGNCHARWEGVDETVVKKFATAAGRPPRAPYINTDQGDILLFVFLLAGTAGGFAGGYFFRELFPRKGRSEKVKELRGRP